MDKRYVFDPSPDAAMRDLDALIDAEADAMTGIRPERGAARKQLEKEIRQDAERRKKAEEAVLSAHERQQQLELRKAARQAHRGLLKRDDHDQVLKDLDELIKRSTPFER